MEDVIQVRPNIVFRRPFAKRFTLCYRTVCLSVTLVYCGQTVGWIRMPLGMVVGIGQGHFVLDGNPAAPLRKKGQLWGTSERAPSTSNDLFSTHFSAAQSLTATLCHVDALFSCFHRFLVSLPLYYYLYFCGHK